MDQPVPFRAVIVGGGLVGLTAAHIFSKVGIDFVVLEKHDTVLASRGTSLALWPQTFRLFDQLGLLEAVKPILDHINEGVVLSAENGRIRRKDNTTELVERNHGYGIRFMDRPQMIEFLYDSLPNTAKSCILLTKKVVDIEILEEKVNVICDDGSSHGGSIVIGADGVRSHIRLLSQALRACCEPKELPQAQLTPYTTTYRLYFADIPLLPGLAPNTRYDSIHQGVCTQIINGTSKGCFGIYEKLDTPTSTSARYTQAHKAAMLKRWGHLYVAPEWTVSEVNDNCTGDSGLIDLEEGLIEQWSYKRIVLVGDAIRKLEPHAGLGYNSGVTDLVVLMNSLRRLLLKDKYPGTPALEELFKSYQDARMKDTLQMIEISMESARLLAWLDWKHMVIGKYALTLLPLTGLIIKKTISPLISQTPVLEWLEERSLPKSLVKWKYHPVQQGD
ncbi:putative monooxygenase [Truncatella angustata]|uniref:Monooxygenase n=1 Tax=Truncatella angustata TaxID=152316 RepID=A0A9P8UUH7_9PEZI|nr:putative monooxygenase [Truncatella angustata]KAH6658463.1 putative monooxygenase [Truncatella angustata]KAH8195394.1 hypothetical protein TruAng_010451 [Truncatella angustata]